MALKQPDTKEDAFDGKIKASKDVGGRIIEVVSCKEGFKDKKDSYIIITAYYK